MFAEALETALGDVYIGAILSYRGKGNVAKHFFEAHAEESKNLFIQLYGNLMQMMDTATALNERIITMQDASVATTKPPKAGAKKKVERKR